MDLNYLLIWMVAASTIVHVLAIRARTGGKVPRPWLISFWVVLGTLGGLLLLAPGYAGLVATPLWLLLIVLPMVLSVLLKRWTSRGRFRAAAMAASLLSHLHRSKQARIAALRFSYYAGISQHDYQRAERALAEMLEMTDGALETPDSEAFMIHGWARIQSLALKRNWQDIVDFVEKGGASLIAVPEVLGRYLFALGETGQTSRMLQTWLAIAAQRQPLALQLRNMLTVAMFTGQVDEVEQLVSTSISNADNRTRAFARATALQAAGRYAEATPLLKELASQSEDARLAAMGEDRLQNPIPTTPSSLLPEGLKEDFTHQAKALAGIKPTQPKRPWATWGILTVLLGFFVAELPGGSTNPENLFSLGMLVLPMELSNYGWWRFITATFLHFGALHFTLNSVALLIFGTNIERLWGPLRFLIVYFASNLVAMVAVALLADATPSEPQMIVGASGGVMGLLGAITAVMLLRWRRNPTRVNRSQLVVLLMVLAIQIVFDASTPMVSGTAHLGGLITGFAIGLLFARRKLRPKKDSPMPIKLKRRTSFGSQ